MLGRKFTILASTLLALSCANVSKAEYKFFRSWRFVAEPATASYMTFSGKYATPLGAPQYNILGAVVTRSTPGYPSNPAYPDARFPSIPTPGVNTWGTVLGTYLRTLPDGRNEYQFSMNIALPVPGAGYTIWIYAFDQNYIPYGTNTFAMYMNIQFSFEPQDNAWTHCAEFINQTQALYFGSHSSSKKHPTEAIRGLFLCDAIQLDDRKLFRRNKSA